MARTSSSAGTKDTAAWILQTWLFFAAALLVACLGLYHLPVDKWIQGYLTMGLFFTLGSTFSLAKMVRDNRFKKIDTNAWTLQVWLAFLISILLTSLGIYNMKAEIWIQGYAAIALAFVVSTAFTLAKTVRDNTENDPFAREFENDGASSDVRPGHDMSSAASRVVPGTDMTDAGKESRLSREEVVAAVRKKQLDAQ